ncbi:hypothetical protein DFH06DRAFT_1474302 [Mycena polygramma]|nr:hypothetical protein DFH06DRAFT_1474302 [Mycena polygramma]
MVLELWSVISRKDCYIFELLDTNLESWHHLFNGTCLEGKQNRGLDQLIRVFYEIATPQVLLSVTTVKHELWAAQPPKSSEIEHGMEVTQCAQLDAHFPVSDIRLDLDTVP